MVVYRITLKKWAGLLAGSGYPARWNPKGCYVIYTAGSRALACLENLVHRSGEGSNQSFCLTEIAISDSASVRIVDPASLHSNWHGKSEDNLCRKMGYEWYQKKDTLLLRVPSAIIPDEWNVLINANHPDMDMVRIKKIVSFRFDNRLH